MKKIDWKILIVTSLLCLAPIAIGLMYYDALPESVAIHFDINQIFLYQELLNIPKQISYYKR